MTYKGQIICSIIILFIGAFSFSNGQKLTKSSKWFSVLLVSSFVQLMFDIFSVYTVNHLETVSPILNRVVHCFYMGFMQLLFYLAYKYIEEVIWEEIGEGLRRLRGSVIPLILAVLGVIFLPLYYVETPKGNYSYGPAAFMIYIGVAVYLIMIFVILIKHAKDIPPKKRRAIIIAMLSELVVALYQIIVPTALVTCLGITLLNLGIYLTVENPDALLVELLEKETKRADVANQAKTNFLANMSHEIRTPINAVLGMNEMILRESSETTVKEYAMDVQGAARSLLSIINDILDITKIEAGKLTIIPVEYAFSSMIYDVTNMIAFKARTKELTFEIDIDERIPSRLIGDDIRIRQILVNLLNNAVKYTHQGTVTLAVKLLPGDSDNVAKIGFSVQDTGIGIKEEDIRKLYIPFERIEEKRNRNIEGTGLGMNITMQLLALLDSKLEVESEYGKGSTFSFVLNQEIVNPEPIGNLGEQIAAERTELEHYIAYEAPDAKVLVVDDNEMNRKVFRGLLKETLIQVTEAESGKECLEKVANTTYDIIFMDHMMPELDGIETFRIMKQMGDYPNQNTPVVILTANAIVGAREQYLQEGFNAFLSKPIEIQNLEDVIEELLDDSLLHYVEKKAGGQQGRAELALEELPVVDGLDWKYAAGHFKDVNSMLESVKFFASALEYEAGELEGLLGGIAQEEGRKNYCTKVHGMKSSAGIVGIVPLAGMAKVLEDAARNNECDVIVQLTPVFLKRWRAYKELLQSFSEPQVEKMSADENREQIAAILQQIRNAAEEMDIDALDELLKQLEAYEFAGEQQEAFERIKKAVIDFDVDYLQNMDEILCGSMQEE